MSAAAALLAAHRVSHPGASEAALELVRVHIGTGHVHQALAVLETLPASTAEGLRLRLQIEQIHARMLLTFNAAEAANAADRIWHAADRSRITPEESADADRTRSSLILEAAAYREVPARRADEALNDLAVAASLLLDSGWTEDGLAAALELARWQCHANGASTAYLSFAEDAAQRGRADFAATAYLRQAGRMLALGAPVAGIRAHIDTARRHFDKAGNDLGLIDSAYAEARLRTQLLDGSLSELEDVYAAYEGYSVPGRSLAVTLDLATAARRYGDFEMARRYRSQAGAIATAAGLTMPRAVALLQEIDDFIAADALPKAILLGTDALAHPLPRLLRACVEASLARAHGLSGDSAETRQHLDRAITSFDAVEADADASAAVARIVAAALPAADETLLRHCADVARAFAGRDRKRADAQSAAVKHQLRAQCALQLQRLQPQTQCLNEAEKAIADAVTEAERLDATQRPRSFGEIAKISGQIAVLSNDLARAERSYRNAIDLFDNAGLAHEAAHCRLIVGGMRSRAYRESVRRNDKDAAEQHFEEAEDAFNAATSVFESQNMPTESARALRMLAQLYIAAGAAADAKAASHLRAQAALEDAEKALDAARIQILREPYADQLSKRATITQESRQLYAAAAEGSDSHADEASERLWTWHQKSRQRAILDALPPSKEQPAGAAPQLDSIRALLDQSDGRRLALVDFIVTHRRIGLMVTTRDGIKPVSWLRAETHSVRHLAEEWSNQARLRRRPSDGRETFDALRAFVAPLADLTAPGDELVLCPSGPLAHFPLHALDVEGIPLLRRNAVSYAPSIAAWHTAVMRPRATRARASIVIADPLSDCPGCRITGEKIAMRLGTAPILGRGATVERALPAMSDAHILHFHGQTIAEARHPSRSTIVFADGSLSAADIAGMHIAADLVVLGLHQASQPSHPAEEPAGLPLAFLTAGSRAVIAPLWPIDDQDAGPFLERLYHNLAASPGLPISDVLRRTALQLMTLPEFSSPYHWANYVVYGDGAA